MGGTYSPSTAEFAATDGTTSVLENYLQYPTKYVFIDILCLVSLYSSPFGLENLTIYPLYRWACIIQDGETGVLTGGQHPEEVDDWKFYTTNYVTRYDLMGVVESLPQLNYERRQHACTALDIDGKKVRPSSKHYYCEAQAKGQARVG